MKHHLSDQQLLDHLYQALTDTQRQTMDVHLAACPECRARLAAQEAIERQMCYSVQAARRQLEPPVHLTFATIAPRLHRSRFSLAVKKSGQLFNSAAALLLVVALGLGLLALLANLSQTLPAPRPPIVEPTAEVNRPIFDRPPAGELKWQFKAEGPLTAPPTITGGVAYFASTDKHLYAVDVETGQARWKFATGDIIYAAPTVSAGAVYFGSGDSYLYALNSQTGQELWRFKSGGPVAATPTVAEGVVYVGSDDANLYALDSQTGRVKWKFKADEWEWLQTRPVVVSNTVYVNSGCLTYIKDVCRYYRTHRLYALNGQTGQVKWKYDSGGFVVTVPVIADGMAYIGNNDGHLYALDNQTGEEKWRFQTIGPVDTAPAVADGIVYVGASDGHLYAVDGQTGQEKWNFKAGPFGVEVSTPIITAETVYFWSNKSRLHALDRQTGQELWQSDLPGAANSVKTVPTIDNGIIYYGDDDSYLKAVR